MKVSRLCSYFGVSRQAYYQQQHRIEQQVSNHTQVLELVKPLRNSNTKLGSKKLYKQLAAPIHKIDCRMGRDKFIELLRQHDLLVKRRRKYAVTTQSFGGYRQYKDHYNGQSWSGPHQVWVSDITYIRVGEKFMYLFLTTDAWSRKIVGWQLAETLESKWALKTVQMAIRQCPDTRGLVHHSDRGFQYCSHKYTRKLKKRGIIISMGQAGNCYDNALAERVNGILKDEYLLDAVFPTGDLARLAVEQAIWNYNEIRPHWSLKLKVPSQVHRAA
jgi:putative transposase